MCGNTGQVGSLVVTRAILKGNRLHFSFPARVTVSSRAKARAVAEAACALPPMTNQPVACPADMGTTYRLTVRWLHTATLPVADLSRPATGGASCRAILNRISRKQDGAAAAANTANRKRAVLNNLMQYAVEIGALPQRHLVDR